MTPDQPTTVPPGWYPDPHGVAELRWWDGSEWTDNIHNAVTPAQEYHVPGQIEDEGGAAVFDLDYVPESTPELPEATPQVQNSPPAEQQAAPVAEASPMHEIFAVDAEPVDAEPVDAEPAEPALGFEPAQWSESALPSEPALLSEPTQATQVQPNANEPATAEPWPIDVAPVEPAPAEPAPIEPAPIEEFFVAPPISAVPLHTPPLSAAPNEASDAIPAATPTTTPDAQSGAQSGDQNPLPSRRELRQRAQEAEGSHSDAQAESTDHTLSQQEAQPVQHTQRAGESNADADGAVLPEAPTYAAPATPSAPAAAFDTSVPTSFNWAVDAPVTPSVAESGASGSSAAPVQAPVPAPVQASAPEPTPTELPTLDPAQQIPDLSAFPPPAAPSLPDESSGIGALGLQSAPLGLQSAPLVSQGSPQSASAPVAGADSAWEREDASFGLTDPAGPPSALPSSTVSSWLIAFLPLIAGILSVGAVKGAENYPRYAPEGATWWMLVGGVLIVLFLVTLMLAVADRKKLDSWGHSFPAHWAWAFATAPAYLAARTVEVKRQTGRMTPQLWVWIVLTLIVVGAYFAAATLAPTLVAGYTLPIV